MNIYTHSLLEGIFFPLSKSNFPLGYKYISEECKKCSYFLNFSMHVLSLTVYLSFCQGITFLSASEYTVRILDCHCQNGNVFTDLQNLKASRKHVFGRSTCRTSIFFLYFHKVIFFHFKNGCCCYYISLLLTLGQH